MKRRLKELAFLLAGLAVIGVIVLVSGIVPIKASSGHWPITAWVLNFAKVRSVNLHSSGIVVPRLDEPQMVRLGAGTYHSNCSWCHGLPGTPQPVVPAQSTPRPPSLAAAASNWEPQELFYIIKHGIKFTGMPAWPTQMREDEIWPVVAFLQSYAEMDHSTYQQHVNPEGATDSPISQLVARHCAACHGFDGTSRGGPRVPVLAGQSEDYLRATLEAYREGARYSGVMQPIAARLSEQQISALATHFTNQSPPASESAVAPTATTDSLEKAHRLATQGDQAEKIPSCVDCHGPAGSQRNSEYPILAGQPAPYLRGQLNLFRTRSRGGTTNANLMHPTANKLTPTQIEALADYYQQLGF